MTTRVKHERSDFANIKLGENLARLDEGNDEALRVIEGQNEDINFRLDHRHTVVTNEHGRISVGTVSETYAPLLTMDGDRVADVYIRIVEGDDVERPR